MNKLVIQDDEGKTTVVPLIRDEITIGRREGNTIRLTERNVSRRHARIVRSTDAISIEDLDSYNGVRVNGSRIDGRANLALSDRVQIGDYLIELKAEAGVSNGADTVPLGDKTQPLIMVEPSGEDGGDSGPTAAKNTLPLDDDLPAVTVETPALSNDSDEDADDDSAAPSAAPIDDIESTAVTTPLSTLDGKATGSTTLPAPHARLVVLSTELAGSEYSIARSAVIIGRTDDNDIVIDHRSISRNHAKILHEGGRYVIVDLGSSNGVRVNGEEYGKVELRKADAIDLGHVRLRFVEAAEDFVFARDAEVVTERESRGNGGLVVTIIVLAVVAAVAIYFATQGKGKSGAQGKRNGAAITSVPSVTSQDKEVAQWIERAQDAYLADDWPAAIAAAKSVLALDPKNSRAAELIASATAEQDTQKRYERLREAAKAQNYTTVVASYRAVPEGSRYWQRAEKLHDDARAEYAAGRKSRVRTLVNAGKCGEVKAQVAQASKLWQSVGQELARIGAQCAAGTVAKAPVRTPPPPRSKKPVGSKKPATSDKPETSTEPSRAQLIKEAQELSKKARDAGFSGNWTSALRYAQQALKKHRSNSDAALWAGMAGCNLKNAAIAKRYYAKLRGSKKEQLKRTCAMQGIVLE